MKVGDKVRIVNVDKECGLGKEKIGREGTVVRVDMKDSDLPIKIETEGWEYWLNESNLELL